MDEMEQIRQEQVRRENRQLQVAQTAFEAYVKAVSGRTHDGKPIPNWGQLSKEVQAGWLAAAKAVMREAG